MRISLGPNQYYWSETQLHDFYAQAAQWPVDVIYLGETVCSKRRPYGAEAWLEIGHSLAEAGKEVVLSTLTLIEARSEMGTVKRLVENGEFLIEAGDMAAVQLASERGLPFVTGPNVNIYNAQTLQALRRAGLVRWVVPTELSRPGLEALLEAARAIGVEGVETEVFGYGRIPLAYSARCFTARAHNLPKDRCDFKCQQYPEGLALDTQEDQNFLTINGVQLQSGQIHNLLAEWPTMRDLGVDLMRISPQPEGTSDVIAALKDMLESGTREMPEFLGTCNGYWFGEAGMARV